MGLRRRHVRSRSAAFDNPDHVAIVIHNYRWRLDLADGERKYDDLEKKLAQGPVITVPTITMEGDANGAPHPEPAAYRRKFSAKYEHRLITGGVGHNPFQEAPQAFAQAIVDVAEVGSTLAPRSVHETDLDLAFEALPHEGVPSSTWHNEPA